MDHWIAPAAALLAGTVGGFVNAGMSGAGTIVLPGQERTTAQGRVIRLGAIGNGCVGAIAALVSWAMYGAASGKSIVDAAPADMTWAGFGAAILVGVGGARWLSAEVDRTILKKTAEVAARQDADPHLAATIASSTPAEALLAAVAK